MKRVYALLIAIIAAVLLVSPILAAYYATFTVTESDGNAYTMLPVMVDSPNTWMVNNGFMQADAMDTRVETLGGTAQPHMVTDNRVLSALAVPDNSQTNLYFTTQESTNLTSMDIITGYGGFITTADHADIELGDNFSVSVSGYWDTDNGTAKYSVNKTQTIQLFVSPTVSGNITAIVYDWTSPTGNNNPADWQNEGNARDDNLASYADVTGGLGAGLWSGWLDLTVGAMATNQVQFYIYTSCASPTWEIELDGVQIYSGTLTNSAWVTINGVDASATSLEIRMHNGDGAPRFVRVHEADYGNNPTVTATGVASGVHTVNLTSAYTGATANLSLIIDGSQEDTVAMTANVSNTAYAWTWMQNNILPYADNITIVVDGVQVLLYCPNDMIATTVLPDRAGTAQNGAITWGANPSGVGVALGSLVSEDQPVVGSTIDETPRDIIEEVEVSDWFEAPDVSGTLLTNPMRPFVTMMSDTTTITELQAWRLLGLAFVLLCTAGAAALARGHLLIVGIAGGAAIGACCALTIFPLWMLIFAIGAVAGGLVAERSPSL